MIRRSMLVLLAGTVGALLAVGMSVAGPGPSIDQAAAWAPHRQLSADRESPELVIHTNVRALWVDLDSVTLGGVHPVQVKADRWGALRVVLPAEAVRRIARRGRSSLPLTLRLAGGRRLAVPVSLVVSP